MRCTSRQSGDSGRLVEDSTLGGSRRYLIALDVARRQTKRDEALVAGVLVTITITHLGIRAWLVVSFPGFHVLNSSMSPGSGRHVLGASPLNWIYELSDDYKLALPV